MSLRVIMLIPVLCSIWDLITTFLGVADFFDLPTNPDINPGQFAFGVVVTAIVFGFVLLSHLIWNLKMQDTPALLLKAAWATCVAIDLFTSWQGTKRAIFYDDDDFAKGFGIAVAAALIVASTLLLSRFLLANDIRDKPFLS